MIQLFKTKSLKKTHKKEKSQGRSMVEMLGVLAIIGVLSIAGIQGYKIAMRRYQANEVLNVANIYANIAFTGAMTYVEDNPQYFETVNYGSSGFQVTRIKSGLSTNLYNEVKDNWKERLSPSVFSLGIRLPAGVKTTTTMQDKSGTYTLSYFAYTGLTIFHTEDKSFIRIRVYFTSKELCKTVNSMVTNLLPNMGASDCGSGSPYVIADFHMN